MMRRLLGLIVLVTLLTAALFSPTPLATVRAASCSTQSGSGNGSVLVNISVSAGDIISITASDGIPNGVVISVAFPGIGIVSDLDSLSITFSRTGSARVSFHPLPLAPAFTYNISVCRPGDDSGSNTGPIPPFNDGRLNNWDAHETSAIYCMGDGSVRVYVPGDPRWRVAFDASPTELASVPKNPAVNTVIKSGNSATLLRLQDGRLQVDTPALEPSKGNYSFAFQDCPIPNKQSSNGIPPNNAAPSFQLGDGSSFGN